MFIRLKDNITFVRKAKDDPPKPKKTHGSYGASKLTHKYVKKEPASDGTEKYIYDEAKGKKAPTDKDSQDLLVNIRQTLQQDKYWKKFEPHFEDADFMNIFEAMQQRGEMVDPSMFLSELDNIKGLLGARASNYLPTNAVIGEYKKIFSMASNRPSDYNAKVTEGAQKKEIDSQKQSNADIKDLSASGLNDQVLQDLRNNPTKVKKLIGKLKKLIGE